MEKEQHEDGAAGVAFGSWLLTQRSASGFVGQLANAAAADRAFPRTGNVDAVRKWLQASRASGDDWEALEDAETNWAALAA